METVPKAFEIYTAGFYFYSATDRIGQTVRYIIRMNEEIDGDALRRAFDTTMLRYPYLRLKVVKGEQNDHYEYNDAPLVVLETSQALTLGGEQVNGHQIALTYFRRSIYINNSHALVDGRGRGPFMKTLLYYYCTYRYGEEVQMEDVNLVGSPVDPQEWEDPFLKKLPPVKPLTTSSPSAHGKVMNLLNMGLVTKSDPLVHCLRIDEKVFMNWCKSHDSTPNVAVMLMLSRAIHKIHPEAEEEIVANLACDWRKTLGVPKCHWSLVGALSLAYDKKVQKLDIMDQSTVYRGRIIIQSDPDELSTMVDSFKKLYDAIYSMPVAQKVPFCRSIMEGATSAGTFLVSYTGKVSYGSCDKHIRGLFSEPNVGLPLNIEITAIGGYLLLDIQQMWKEDFYYDVFRHELADNGIPSETIYTYDQRCTLYEVDEL